MKKSELIEMEKQIEDEMVKRRRLGGFDANAETILKMVEWQRDMIRHLRESAK